MPSAPQPSSHLELNLTSDPAQLAPARKCVESFGLAHGLGQQAADEVGLCINEAMANITRHAYAGRTDGRVVVRAVDTGDAVQVVMRDWGNGVNPTNRVPKNKDPLVPGGLGLICLRQLMDEVRYEPQPDGMVLTLVKRKPGG
jgi:anti-sigma regulatory factor (Ser/Thr protein kinase)